MPAQPRLSKRGHMIGHVCAIARSTDHTYILAGDLTHRQRNLLADQVGARRVGCDRQRL